MNKKIEEINKKLDEIIGFEEREKWSMDQNYKPGAVGRERDFIDLLLSTPPHDSCGSVDHETIRGVVMVSQEIRNLAIVTFDDLANPNLRMGLGSTLISTLSRNVAGKRQQAAFLPHLFDWRLPEGHKSEGFEGVNALQLHPLLALAKPRKPAFLY